MAPAVDVMEANHSSGATVAKENQKSVQVLDELLGKLTISKSADETKAAAGNLATFINGPIEEHDAPTK
jgi:elongation factor 3